MFEPEIKLLQDALDTLADVESRYEASALSLDESVDRDMIQEVFHSATHEAATNIGFALNDIKTLVDRLEIRATFPISLPRRFSSSLALLGLPIWSQNYSRNSAMVLAIRWLPFRHL